MSESPAASSAPRVSTVRVQEERDRARNARRAWGAILKTRRRCQVCKINFSSEVNGLQHFRGKAHARAIELKAGPYNCIQCVIAFPRKNELEQHMLSKAHIRRQIEIETARSKEQ